MPRGQTTHLAHIAKACSRVGRLGQVLVHLSPRGRTCIANAFGLPAPGDEAHLSLESHYMSPSLIASGRMTIRHAPAAVTASIWAPKLPRLRRHAVGGAYTWTFRVGLSSLPAALVHSVVT